MDDIEKTYEKAKLELDALEQLIEKEEPNRKKAISALRWSVFMILFASISQSWIQLTFSSILAILFIIVAFGLASEYRPYMLIWHSMNSYRRIEKLVGVYLTTIKDNSQMKL